MQTLLQTTMIRKWQTDIKSEPKHQSLERWESCPRWHDTQTRAMMERPLASHRLISIPPRSLLEGIF